MKGEMWVPFDPDRGVMCPSDPEMADQIVGRSYNDIHHPKYYTTHPSGVECIQVAEFCSFCIGNAIKYLWRFQEKDGIKDLEKAIWYIKREIERLK